RRPSSRVQPLSFRKRGFAIVIGICATFRLPTNRFGTTVSHPRLSVSRGYPVRGTGFFSNWVTPRALDIGTFPGTAGERLRLWCKVGACATAGRPMYRRGGSLESTLLREELCTRSTIR